MAEYYSKWTGGEIDEGIGKALESIDDKTPTFNKASDRENIVSGEKLSTIFGKIVKWFVDLKAVAFSGDYNDLSNKPNLFSGKYSDLSGAPAIPAAVAVKGDNESNYRTGNVNLTPANIGALPQTGGTVSGALTVNGTLFGNGRVEVVRDSSGNATLQVGNKLNLRTDAEGGNIRISPPDGNSAGVSYWEADSWNGNFRIYALKNDIVNTALVLNPAVSGSLFYGNSASASKLQTPRKINGISFDGSADITLPLAALGAFGAVKTLTSADDVNSITQSGFYVWYSNSIPSNAPLGGAVSLLEVMFFGDGSTNRILQRATRLSAAGQCAFRTWTGSAWNNWANITTTVTTSLPLDEDGPTIIDKLRADLDFIILMEDYPI